MDAKALATLVDEMISEAEKFSGKKSAKKILELNKKFGRELE